MKFFLKQIIYLLPILLMAVSFLSCFVPEFNYALWGNLAGFSLVTDVLFFYIFYYGNYCLFTKLMPIALFIVNLVNIYGVYYPDNYETWYEIVVFCLFLTIISIYELKKHLDK